MDISQSRGAKLAEAGSFNPIPVAAIGVGISFLLVLNGILFKTYAIAMASPPVEAARQFGLLYILAEIGVILYALRQGLDVRQIWSGLSRFARYCSVFFLSIFWIGGAFQSEMPLFATAQNIMLIIHIVFAFAVYHSVSRIEVSGMHRLVMALAAGLLVFCGMTAFAFLNHPPLETMPNNEIIWQFAIPGFISLRLFGAFCGAIFCFMLAQLLLDEEAGQKRFWPYVWLTLCAAMTIWSGTRNAVVGVLIAAMIMMIFYRLRPLDRRSGAFLFLSIIVATFLAISFIPFNDPNFMLISAGDGASADSMSGGRLTYWLAIWKAYQTVPLFGAGPFASFWILPEGAATHVQPHNIILQFLTSWGLPATMAAVAMLSYATWKAHVVALKCRNILPFLSMLDSLLVMSFFDGTLHFAQPLMLIMMAFGAIFNAGKMMDARV